MFEEIKNKLNKNLLNSKNLTSNFKFLDNNSKKTIMYNDNFYIPFFYYLGNLIKPKSLFELGLNLSIQSSCFLKSCKTVDYFLGFQQKNEEYYNINIPRSNLNMNYNKDYNFYYGNFFDEGFQKYLNKKFDLIFINQEYNFDKLFEISESLYLNNLNKEGMMVFCDISKKNTFDIFDNMTKGYRNTFENINNKIGVITK